MKKNKENTDLLRLTKETPAVRKKRVTSGVRLRAAVFENKKRKAQQQKYNWRGGHDGPPFHFLPKFPLDIPPGAHPILQTESSLRTERMTILCSLSENSPAFAL